jgi:hypothetical protein
VYNVTSSRPVTRLAVGLNVRHAQLVSLLLLIGRMIGSS